MGGQIETAKDIPTIGPGDSYYMEFIWPPPNPDDYWMFGTDQNHFCLYARIETAGAPGYGLTFPEVPNEISSRMFVTITILFGKI